MQVQVLSPAPKHRGPNLQPIGETFGFVVLLKDVKQPLFVAVWEFSCTAIVLSIYDLKGLFKMEKYRKIEFILWTIANAFLTLWLWKYLPIAPLFVVQIIVSVCCSILFFTY